MNAKIRPTFSVPWWLLHLCYITCTCSWYLLVSLCEEFNIYGLTFTIAVSTGVMVAFRLTASVSDKFLSLGEHELVPTSGKNKNCKN